MKRVLTAIAMAAAAALTLLSCEKYDDGKPSKDVRSEFNKMYPGARDVEWEPEFGNWVVSFETGKVPNVKEHEAWYDVSGNWLRTETDVRESDLPKAVRDALEASEYASPYLKIDDIDFVETPDGDFYQVDVEVAGVEISLDVTTDGVISVSSLGI
jgi:hypothetical protein